MDEILYDVRALARRLQCCSNTAYKLVRNNTIKHARVGKLFRITQSAVDEFLRGGGSSGQSRTEEKEAA